MCICYIIKYRILKNNENYISCHMQACIEDIDATYYQGKVELIFLIHIIREIIFIKFEVER